MFLLTFGGIQPSMNLSKKHIPILIIFIFHLVGFIGFILNPAYFRPLSPLNLLLSAGLVLLMSSQKKWQFYLSFFTVTLIGFIIEVLGVKTELVFGSYFYGNSFGVKYLSVPLLIGLNWAVLLYSTSQFTTFKNKWFNILLGSGLMVLLDFFIEQSAAKFDFWYWKNGYIPLQNYVAWFVISIGLNALFQNILKQKPNITAKAFYIIELIFFSCLYFFVK